MGDMNVPL